LRITLRPTFLGGDPLAVFDRLCRPTLVKEGREVFASGNPLDAKMWVSRLLGRFSNPPTVGEADTAEAIGGRFVPVAQKRRTPEAQMCLRALAAVAGDGLAGGPEGSFQPAGGRSRQPVAGPAAQETGVITAMTGTPVKPAADGWASSPPAPPPANPAGPPPMPPAPEPGRGVQNCHGPQLPPGAPAWKVTPMT